MRISTPTLPATLASPAVLAFRQHRRHQGLTQPVRNLTRCMNNPHALAVVSIAVFLRSRPHRVPRSQHPPRRVRPQINGGWGSPARPFSHAWRSYPGRTSACAPAVPAQSAKLPRESHRGRARVPRSTRQRQWQAHDEFAFTAPQRSIVDHLPGRSICRFHGHAADSQRHRRFCIIGRVARRL